MHAFGILINDKGNVRLHVLQMLTMACMSGSSTLILQQAPFQLPSFQAQTGSSTLLEAAHGNLVMCIFACHARSPCSRRNESNAQQGYAALECGF